MPEPVRPDAPRLLPGVPFPPYAFVPGAAPHPRRSTDGHSAGAPPPAPGLPAERWAEDRTYLRGIDLYHAGYLWEAHEAFEAVYFASAGARHRRLLQALIQLAAAVLQARRGVGRGVTLLAGAVAEKLARVAAETPPGGRLAGLDPHALLADVRRHFGPSLADAAPVAGAPLVDGPPPALAVTTVAAAPPAIP